MVNDSIRFDVNGRVATVTFDRPATRNSLSKDVLNQLDSVLNQLMPDSGVAAIVFTGSENVFLSGANILELTQLDEAAAHEFSETGQQLFERVACAKQTTLAAINGYCLGGGLDFALACDIRIASKRAEFAHPGARLGIITGWGGTQRLPRIIGVTSALELFTTAQRINSAEALRIGLITAICDPVLAEAQALAESIVNNPS